MGYNNEVISKLEDKLMKNLFTRLGGGALGLNLSKDADLGSQDLGALGSKGSQGADFALEDKGALGLNTSEDADLGSQNCGALGSNLSKDADFALENFNGASKTRHSETPKAGSESV